MQRLKIYHIQDTLGRSHGYVGKTSKTVEKRWQEHNQGLKNKKTILAKSLKCHGSETYQMTHIFTVLDEKDVDEFEKFFIKELKTHYTEGGLNVTWGGDGTTTEFWTAYYANLTPEEWAEKSETSRRIALERSKNGTHNFTSENTYLFNSKKIDFFIA